MSDRRMDIFTLVELLIVIAIIAILAALLLPALTQAQQASHRIKCISNIRQTCSGVHMYAGDYNGFAPSFKSRHPTSTAADIATTHTARLSYGRQRESEIYWLGTLLVDPGYWQAPVLQCVSRPREIPTIYVFDTKLYRSDARIQIGTTDAVLMTSYELKAVPLRLWTAPQITDVDADMGWKLGETPNEVLLMDGHRNNIFHRGYFIIARESGTAQAIKIPKQVTSMTHWTLTLSIAGSFRKRIEIFTKCDGSLN